MMSFVLTGNDIDVTIVCNTVIIGTECYPINEIIDLPTDHEYAQYTNEIISQWHKNIDTVEDWEYLNSMAVGSGQCAYCTSSCS